LAQGARRIAVVSAVVGATNIRTAARALYDRIKAADHSDKPRGD